MKVIFKKPITDRLVDAITSAEIKEKTIEGIELTYREYKEFRKFMRVSCMATSYKGGGVYTFMGIKIKPSDVAQKRLNNDNDSPAWVGDSILVNHFNMFNRNR